MTIRALTPEDDRSSFESGDDDLDRFFHLFAGQNQFRHHVGATYVAVDGSCIHGFATVAPADMEADDLPASARRSLRQYPAPVLRVARLATAKSSRGRGVGKALLRYAFHLAMELAERYGCIGVLIDAKEGAISLYEDLGFIRLELVQGQSDARPGPAPLFLSLKQIRAAARS